MKHVSKTSGFLAPFAAWAMVNAFFLLWFMLHPSFRSIAIIYTINTTWIPAVLLVLGIAGLADWRRQAQGSWIRRCTIGCLAAAAALGYLRLHTNVIEPNLLILREVQIESPKVEQPLRILHISDLQAAEVGRYEARAIAKIAGIECDIILHTGDLLQPRRPATHGSEVPKLAELLGTLDPPLGLYGIYGTTDGYLRKYSAGELGGMQMLDNEERIITAGGHALRVLALSNRASGNADSARVQLDGWLGDGRPDEFTILLGHEPDYAAAAQDYAIDLCLAGHTHGGQIRVPFFGALVTGTEQVPRSWARGYREIGETRLNVSAGIGCEHAGGVPDMRFNCPSEITLITVVPAGKRE